MEELLQNPAIQAGVVPFVTALIAAALLMRTRLLGLAQVAGFAAVVALAIGFSFESLTSTRKLVLVGLFTLLPILLLELREGSTRAAARAAIALVAGLAGVWVALRVLQQKETAAALLAGVAAALYLAALVESTLRVGSDPVRGAATGLMLGLAGGALALLGASALLAQMGIAVGAAAGATLLVQMIAGKRSPAGATLSLPASVVAGLVGLLAVFTASLPWYCLLPTLAIPWATRLVPAGSRPVWLTAFLTALAALVPLLLAVGLAWFTAGTPST
ncbi:MAG: hypothetical protein Q8R06_12200 [Polaromonas sp.]|uniref:hypothetical protein n=1 Tax=Polaromonas sp. TaxID=1869339 RepID=UPI002732CB4C|nr:hypothetical protein [Polaromonas sp.]MDP3797893.1 hypothetical protein [Polaromonas sp.]